MHRSLIIFLLTFSFVGSFCSLLVLSLGAELFHTFLGIPPAVAAIPPRRNDNDVGRSRRYNISPAPAIIPPKGLFFSDDDPRNYVVMDINYVIPSPTTRERNSRGRLDRQQGGSGG